VGDITTAWDNLRERCDVHCRLHDLRHTAATKMAEAGVPESTMLAILEHMSRAMLERYSRIGMAAKREVVKSLEMAASFLNRYVKGPAKYGICGKTEVSKCLSLLVSAVGIEPTT